MEFPSRDDGDDLTHVPAHRRRLIVHNPPRSNAASRAEVQPVTNGSSFSLPLSFSLPFARSQESLEGPAEHVATHRHPGVVAVATHRGASDTPNRRGRLTILALSGENRSSAPFARRGKVKE